MARTCNECMPTIDEKAVELCSYHADMDTVRAALARKLVEAVEAEQLEMPPDNRADQAYAQAIIDALTAMARVLAKEGIELVAKDGEGEG